MKTNTIKEGYKINKRTLNNACMDVDSKQKIDSKERRNVSKYLVRYILKKLKSNVKEYKEHCVGKVTKRESYFDFVIDCLTKLSQAEKNRTSKGIEKNYSVVLDMMLANKVCTEILKISLSKILDSFEKEKYGNIGVANRDVYHRTMKALYEHACQRTFDTTE